MYNCLSNSNLSPINTGWFVYRTPIISKPEMELNMHQINAFFNRGKILHMCLKKFRICVYF